MGVRNRQEEYVEDGICVHEGITIRELEKCVLSEYRVSEPVVDVALRYWLPNSIELVTGIKIPLVLQTNYGAIKY